MSQTIWIVESLADIDLSDMKLPMFTLYDHPKDFPTKIVARLWEGTVSRPTNAALLFDTLEQAREMFEGRYAWLERGPADDPCIIGVYL